MPALVPSGYTRGSIQFLGAISSPKYEEIVLQDFWSQAGGYGSRILILPSAQADMPLAQRYAELFQSWQGDSAKVLPIADRAAANDAKSQEEVVAATGVLMLGGAPLRFASTIGGTGLAQAIRRANAQGKTVAGLGGCASVLCQHMIAFDTRRQAPRPLLHRQLIQFAPALGIVNRLVLDGVADPEDSAGDRISRLLTAVAYNPFLIGVSLEADTGVALYANGTLDVFGQNSALLIDGSGLQLTNLHEAEEGAPINIFGIQLHVLTRGCTFNVDDKIPHPPATSDIPSVTVNATAAF